MARFEVWPLDPAGVSACMRIGLCCPPDDATGLRDGDDFAAPS